MWKFQIKDVNAMDFEDKNRGLIKNLGRECPNDQNERMKAGNSKSLRFFSLPDFHQDFSNTLQGQFAMYFLPQPVKIPFVFLAHY